MTPKKQRSRPQIPGLVRARRADAVAEVRRLVRRCLRDSYEIEILDADDAENPLRWVVIGEGEGSQP